MATSNVRRWLSVNSDYVIIIFKFLGVSSSELPLPYQMDKSCTWKWRGEGGVGQGGTC